jgi:thiamine-phosphate diphosphorylase
VNLRSLWLCADLGEAPLHVLCEKVSAVLSHSHAVVWLRSSPTTPARDIVYAAHTLRSLTHQRAPLFVGDRVDIAMVIQADGVHLPERSLLPRDVRTITPLRLSAAVHDATRMIAVRDHVDVVITSPFRTVEGKGVALGSDGLRAMRQLARDRVVVALGGIATLEDTRAALDAGADTVAVRRALFDTSLCVRLAHEISQTYHQKTLP